MVILWFVMLGAGLVLVVIPVVVLLTLVLALLPGEAAWRARLGLLLLTTPSLAGLLWTFGTLNDPALIGPRSLAWLSLAAVPAAVALLPEARWRALICGLANAIPPWLLFFLLTAANGLSHPGGP